ncbi:hypothetical protein FSP39_010035 [Pinctada imbricata]|uniref:Uncharacterized protein n=1 Tax=Pinctada imbricata TaxID=66713 RepID=A0AA89BVC1_PINIB|nr:hypothetical protein FSP39_010035 [Pinctada imbricata]
MKLETIKSKRKIRFFEKASKENGRVERTENDIRFAFDKTNAFSDRLPPINIKALSKIGREKATEEQNEEVTIPPGIICNSCAKIGIFVRNEDIQKAIRESSNKKLKEKCIVCKTYQNRNYNEGHVDISETVLYSHNFYDQYSRETKPVSMKNDSGDSVINEKVAVKIPTEGNKVAKKHNALVNNNYEVEDKGCI